MFFLFFFNFIKKNPDKDQICYRAGGGEGGETCLHVYPKISFIFSINQSIQIFIFILRARWKPTEFNPLDKKGGWGGVEKEVFWR
jgi:hypothetical protein